MDVYCPRCGEPWDMDSLHDEAETSGVSYAEVRADFTKNGCTALTTFGLKPGDCVPVDNLRTLAASTMYELLGDDIDGVASLLDDFDYLGMLD